MKRLRPLVLLGCLFPLSGARALAGEAEAARIDFDAAQQAYNLGQFDQALERFADVYRHDPLAEILFDIAQCHRQLGNDSKAAFFYRRYLDLRPRGPSAKLARELLVEMDAHAAAPPSAPVEILPRPVVVEASAPPLWQRGWFWASVGAVATGVTVTAIVLASHSSSPAAGSLGTLDERP